MFARLEHREHAVGDGKIHLRRCPAEQDCEKNPIACSCIVLAFQQNAKRIPADHDNAVHKVGTRHQRRVAG